MRIDRRGFLKTTGTLIATATVAGPTLTAEAESPKGRVILPINQNWKYSRTASAAAQARDFDDSSFESIVVPHTNITLPWHSFDEKSYEFISVYRRRFKLPASARGKHVFVDFEGVMTASTVFLNGTRLGEYKGGFTPFSFELTPHLDWDGENVLVVEVDSTERADIPPFGYQIDYLTFGGIYREVALRIVPGTFIENIFAAPKNVLSGKPTLDIQCFLQSDRKSSGASFTLEAALYDGDKQIAKASQAVPGWNDEGLKPQTIHLDNLGEIKLWDLDSPNLYTVRVRLLQGKDIADEDTRRIGFREATFTDHGFSLNGKIVKLRGLDRHQTFPWVGQAMPARPQRRDAHILKHELSCNLVRTSHYPQSRHFLDACDEIGLLVLEEIPGWQHIGPVPWQDISVDNVSRMIRRDWNHPSIILWGVRINESLDSHDFYVRTNAMAHSLDTTRQTGGIRYFQESEFLEDVFTMNDFGFPLKAPNHPRYLNTEFVGHTYPTKTIDNVERLTEHALRHARIHNQLGSDPQYAGGIGWCAFDYNTHADFGSGDRICYHGVTDIFRTPKPAASFYKSQCNPKSQVVLEPAFNWARGDQSVGFSNCVIFSNCDHLKLYIGGKLAIEIDPDKANFPHLPYPPFVADIGKLIDPWGDLKIEGYLGTKLAVTKNYSGKGVDQKFALLPDDLTLQADGADTTRVVLAVTDEFGAVARFATDAIKLELEGPATLIGDNPFGLVGGTGAIWIRAKQQLGPVTLKATHPVLGTQEVHFTLTPSPAETV